MVNNQLYSFLVSVQKVNTRESNVDLRTTSSMHIHGNYSYKVM